MDVIGGWGEKCGVSISVVKEGTKYIYHMHFFVGANMVHDSVKITYISNYILFITVSYRKW